jgi:hypothetical protein
MTSTITALLLPNNTLGRKSSTQWLVKLLLNELGQQYLDSTKTVKPKYRGKKAFRNFGKNVLMRLLNTKPVGTNFLRIGNLSLSPMASKLAGSECGELVTFTIINLTG